MKHFKTSIAFNLRFELYGRNSFGRLPLVTESMTYCYSKTTVPPYQGKWEPWRTKDHNQKRFPECACDWGLLDTIRIQPRADLIILPKIR